MAVGAAGPVFAAEGCPDSASEIDTDRPDVTNSSRVVPAGSLQGENGVNWSGQRRSGILDGTNSRLRLGVADCTEILVDIPNYFRPLHTEGPRGFSDVAPAVKRQIDGLPGDFVVSAVAGAGVPTGAKRISGPSFDPYIQFPWSREIAEGWSVQGMFTHFWMLGQPGSNRAYEATFSVERELGPEAYLFAEYVGDYPNHDGPRQVLNLGGAWRVTTTQQLDFHTGVGFNSRSPAYFFGLGYSFRFDGLF
jgi:hypothetical protein